MNSVPVEFGKYTETHVFSDKEDIYAYEKMRNQQQPYAQRQTDLTVIETGVNTGVKTYIIMSPLIYGIRTPATSTSSRSKSRA